MSVRQRLLKASLAHVELHGFRQQAICHGAQLLNLSGAAHAILARGPVELAESVLLAAYDDCLRELRAAERLGFADALKTVARRYVASLLPYSTRWNEAMAALAQPANAAGSLRLLRDFTRRAAEAQPQRRGYRASLAALLLLAELHLVSDGSPQLQQTVLFAERRAEELARLRRGLAGLGPVLAGAGVSLRALGEALRHGGV